MEVSVLRIDSIILENYRNFPGINEIKLPYYPKDLCIITGSCGSGKSNLVNAICWLLGELDKNSELNNRCLVPNADVLQNSKCNPVRVRVTLLIDKSPIGKKRIERVAEYSASKLTANNSSTNNFYEPKTGADCRPSVKPIESLFPGNYSKLHIINEEKISSLYRHHSMDQYPVDDMVRDLVAQKRVSSDIIKRLLLETANKILNHMSIQDTDFWKLVASEKAINILRAGELIDPAILSAGYMFLLGYSLYLGYLTVSELKLPVIVDDPYSRLSEMYQLLLAEQFKRLSATRQVILLSNPSYGDDIGWDNPIELDSARAGLSRN